MPKVLETIDNVKETVLRPVVFDITRQVQDWTGVTIPRILYPGETDSGMQPASGIHTDPSFNNFDASSLWEVRVRQEREIDQILATAVLQADHTEVFYDEALKVFLRPVYAQTQLTFEYVFRGTDKNTMQRWRDDLITRISTNRDVRQHIVSYHYLIPENCIALLDHVHALRESHAGYNDGTFSDYLAKHFTQTASVLTTVAGTEGRWGISETQGRVTGMFDFKEGPDEGEKANNTSAWTVSFSYKAIIDVPVGIAMDYPIIIHQQQIDDRWLQIQPKDNLEEFASRSSLTTRALGAFEVWRLAQPTVKSGIRIPEYHEFYPEVVPRHTLQVLSTLLSVMPLPAEPGQPAPNPRILLNLNELGDEYSFSPEFVKFLKYDHKHIHRYGESMVNVAVYVDDMPLDHKLFFVDEDLNITLVNDPDQRLVYYVRVSLLTNPANLSQPARDRTRQNADGLILIGAAICPNLVTNNLLPKVLSGGYVGKLESEKFFQRIIQCTQSHANGQFADFAATSWNTVMILFIETSRRDA